ncbi:MAG: alanine dehydrogenase [Nanoarchaeota archaeon]|nr:alanine dehydrogenase [Nanoarchaeota archaeon]
MIIGTIKEVKDNENRAGLLPKGAAQLVEAGHKVYVQRGAGVNSGYSDGDYLKAGAKMVPTAYEVVKAVDILVKVKEPIQSEYELLDQMKGKTLFTYLHLAAADKNLTLRLMQNKITSISYETVEDKKGLLPLLKPMSEVAGVLAVQFGAQYLQKKYGGRGVSLGKIENTTPAHVVVLGGGVVGFTSARTAAGLGCRVTVFERLGPLFKKLPLYFKKELSALSQNITLVESTAQNITEALKTTDLLIGGVLLKGAKAPKIVSESMVHVMNPGAVIVDVAIDQGGCIWGAKPTTHSDPIYVVDDKIYCCITNMPGQVPRQSSQALTEATFPYLLSMTNNGVVKALKKDKGLAKGMNVYNGKVVYKAVAEALNLLDYYEEFDANMI